MKLEPLILWVFLALISSSHKSNTPPFTPQTMWDACIQNFFRVSTLYRVGEGRTARKFREGCMLKREPRNNRKIWILCPNDFCPGLSEFWFGGKKSVFFIFPMLFRHFGDRLVITCNNNDHTGPIPLNWSWVQRKLVWHDVLSITYRTWSQKHSVLSIFTTN